uniref:N(4)-(beta-N-acetylglucosaminyl)-L-asparaginase n=1 Tax=Glossina brevipalpis TaxID=37001 RepID=A0A1A9WSG6_9MUSC
MPIISFQRFKKTMLVSIIFCLLNFASANQKLPLVLNTWGFLEANQVAWQVLHESGKSSLDALVEGVSACEDKQCDGTVGYGGSPDEYGETTLDSLIMDGSNMNMGAVAGLRQIKDAIRSARFVLEHTDHSLLVGDAASNFAEMMGLRRQSLTTPASKAMWIKWRQNKCQPNFWVNVVPNAKQQCGPYQPQSNWLIESLNAQRLKYEISEKNHDTIGMIVISQDGQIYAGTSTNGAKYKIPGRVGDSPIPGAGAYADNEVGAAVATGDGDIMMRFLPSLLAVEALRLGETTEYAAINSMKRIARYYSDFSGALLVADRWGNYSAACVGMKKFPYSIAQGSGEPFLGIRIKNPNKYNMNNYHRSSVCSSKASCSDINNGVNDRTLETKKEHMGTKTPIYISSCFKEKVEEFRFLIRSKSSKFCHLEAGRLDIEIKFSDNRSGVIGASARGLTECNETRLKRVLFAHK